MCINALLNTSTGAAQKVFGPKTVEVFTALAPMIQSKRITPMQAITLAMALGKSQQTGGQTPPPKG